MLVLITVAAAVAFYMFETGWQKTATGNVGDGTVSSTQITMSGSTTVTDLMNTVVPAFEKANSGFKVSFTGTGSGAGLIAIEKGQVDIGMISDNMNDVTAGTTTAYPNLVATTIAYDGVAPFIATTALAAHGITIPTGKMLNMNMTIADAIWGVGAKTSFTATNLGVTFSAGQVDSTGIHTWGGLMWVMHNDTKTTATVPIAASDQAKINIYFRSDSSGTQDAFSLLGLGKAKCLTYANPTANQIGESGNPAMITGVTGDNNGIGFATAGMVSTTSTCTGFAWNGITPTAAHVIAAANAIVGKDQYAVWHPLELVTNGAPATDVKSFIDWVTAPDNNIALCNAAGFCSVYQSA
jgi:ABC-type phosphate transport system substrate-binding protein